MGNVLLRGFLVAFSSRVYFPTRRPYVCLVRRMACWQRRSEDGRSANEVAFANISHVNFKRVDLIFLTFYFLETKI